MERRYGSRETKEAWKREERKMEERKREQRGLRRQRNGRRRKFSLFTSDISPFFHLSLFTFHHNKKSPENRGLYFLL
ncbi:hypothetical protein [Flavihumibacter cheonanensis]|uniref:hypothetical protein n=1 Tax=Flavihumibacter cheonanensis TaxID=1442385 RepID=UPI001EF94178|nr:hypothetical protein [Flavihumibacter cheonanensis]MCG7752257.1 hypothetical protein [Flavihumibacter cheonanensis]